MDEKELLVQEEKVEITTPQTENIPESEVDNGTTPLGDNPETSTGDGSAPEQQNPNTSAMGKPTGLFEQLGSQYEKINERATPDGGSITNSVEPQLKEIEDSVAFEQKESENYEANVKVGGLGGNGGVDLDTIDETTSEEYDALVQRDSEIKRKEITHIDHQKKVYDFETELQGQQDDGKGILSNAENKNGSGEQVNPETHVLDAHGGINCKVEENYTEEAGAPSNDSNDMFNSGDLMTPKDKSSVGSMTNELEVPDEDAELEENVPEDDDFEDGKESEDDLPPEEPVDAQVPEEPEVPEANGGDDTVEFGDEHVEPVDGDATQPTVGGGSYTVERIPGIADDDGHGDDLSEKKDQLDAPNFEEHGVFDGSDQATSVNTDGENGAQGEPQTPEHSQKPEGNVPEEQVDKQENSGSLGDDLDGFGVPTDRNPSEGGEPIEGEDGFDNENVDLIEGEDGFDNENVDPIDPEDGMNNDDDDEETGGDDIPETPEVPEDKGEESYGFFNHPSQVHGYHSGFEAEEINVLKMIYDLVD